jgi:hypothetical protein
MGRKFKLRHYRATRKLDARPEISVFAKLKLANCASAGRYQPQAPAALATNAAICFFVVVHELAGKTRSTTRIGAKF